jgi:dimethylamine monooxygenase subunit C
MTNLADTSIPSWVLRPPLLPLDSSGTSYVLVGVGRNAEPVLERWRHDLVDHPVTLIAHADAESACAALVEELRQAQVGVRVRLTGPAGACLSLRGTALNAGLDDDEIAVQPAGEGAIEVSCTHCGAASRVFADVGETVVCSGCLRNLLIYHHVSRRSGRFMGYMVDAEVDAI